MTNQETCNRTDPDIGSCAGCTVPAILWAKTHVRDDVDSVAADISSRYCPDGSGGIDGTTRGTVYNYRPQTPIPAELPVW